MLVRHVQPVPDICDVCKFAVTNNRDHENEHALVRLATELLIADLEEMGGGPARLAGLAVSRFPPVDHGPQHIIEPRHWYWAIFHEPGIQLTLAEDLRR